MTKEQIMFKILKHLWNIEAFDWDEVRIALAEEDFNPKPLLQLLEDLDD
jgi:hypothetical protein